jgi:hypothetical protein
MKLNPELESKCLALSGQPAQAMEFVTEKAFQAELMKTARRLGWLAFHCYDPRKSEAGFPDTVLVRNGRLIFAELKVGDNKMDASQLNWFAELCLTPAEVYIWRPEQWSEIEEKLR